MFPGMKARFTKEMTVLAPPTMNIQVDCSRQRKYATWIGGKMFATLSSFQDKYMKKEEYDEYGASYIHTKK